MINYKFTYLSIFSIEKASVNEKNTNSFKSPSHSEGDSGTSRFLSNEVIERVVR